MASVKVLKQLSLHDIRVILSEQIQKIRDGEATASNVNAISNASGKFIATVKLELEYHKLVGKTPNMPELLSSGDEDEKAKCVPGMPGKIPDAA